MEQKLAAYRARKAKERVAENSLINRLKKSVFGGGSGGNGKTIQEAENGIQDKKGQASGSPTATNGNESNDVDNDDLLLNCLPPSSPMSTTTYWILVSLKFLLWACVWGIFIELQFGAVYFTISLILFIYFNTRTRSDKKEGQLSAYSVFNKNCEEIQGTLTAEKMQRNMFRVPGLPS